jgi:hypothetical protein
MNKKFNTVTSVCLIYPHYFLRASRKDLTRRLNAPGYDIELIEDVHFEPISGDSVLVDVKEKKVIDDSWFTPWRGHLSRDSLVGLDFETRFKMRVNIWGFMFGDSMETIDRGCQALRDRGEGYNALRVKDVEMDLGERATDNREDLTKLMNDKLEKVIDKTKFKRYCPFPEDLFLLNYFGPTRRCIVADDAKSKGGIIVDMACDLLEDYKEIL